MVAVGNPILASLALLARAVAGAGRPCPVDGMACDEALDVR